MTSVVVPSWLNVATTVSPSSPRPERSPPWPALQNWLDRQASAHQQRHASGLIEFGVEPPDQPANHSKPNWAGGGHVPRRCVAQVLEGDSELEAAEPNILKRPTANRIRTNQLERLFQVQNRNSRRTTNLNPSFAPRGRRTANSPTEVEELTSRRRWAVGFG